MKTPAKTVLVFVVAVVDLRGLQVADGVRGSDAYGGGGGGGGGADMAAGMVIKERRTWKKMPLCCLSLS